jgi:hypothetical protein
MNNRDNDEREPPRSRTREHDHDVRIALLEQSMNGIKSELHQINASIHKLVWAIILSLVAAVVQFIIKGGLSV